MKTSELHDKLYNTLCVIDDICKKENVTYFIDSGTEIGSVREKDIIKWDDDIDIKVLRKDYESFKQAMKKNLPEYMHFIEPKDYAPGFHDFIPKVFDERYPLRKETKEDKFYKNYQNRVGIDVFIIDNIPDSAFGRKILYLKHKIIYGMGMSKRFQEDDTKYTFMQKLQIGVLKAMGKKYTAEQICDKWEKLMTKWQNIDTKYKYTSNYPLTMLQTYRKEIFDGETTGELRGRKFPIPIGYDEELRQQYGDYMKPPKKSDEYEIHAELEDRADFVKYSDEE